MGRFGRFAKHSLAPGQTCDHDGLMTAALYMDAVITPNRSLPRAGFLWLIGLLVAFNLIMAVFFVAMGALPVPIFLGLDVLGDALRPGAHRLGAVQHRARVLDDGEARVGQNRRSRRAVEQRDA